MSKSQPRNNIIVNLFVRSFVRSFVCLFVCLFYVSTGNLNIWVQEIVFNVR